MEFEKMLDLVPCVVFAQEFEKRFIVECKKRFGNIVPDDRGKLCQAAIKVLAGMTPMNTKRPS